MGTTTTTFALNKPTVGGDDGTWGTDWNTNADKLDDLLDGTTAIKPNLSEGLWKVGGVAVTASAAELNILDGVTNTVTAAEISYLDGVTDLIQVQLNARQPLDSQLTALAALSTSGILSTNGTSVFARTLIAGTGITISNAEGGTGNPNIAASIASQAEAEAGTDNTKVMTPLRLRNALNATGAAPTYACRAWVNFNGTGTVAIRASGNVSSITDNGTGDYTVNFTTAMPDANYAVTGMTTGLSTSNVGAAVVIYGSSAGGATTKTTSAIRIQSGQGTGGIVDHAEINIAIFR